MLFVFTALLAGALAYWAYNRYLGFADAPMTGLQTWRESRGRIGDSFASVLRKLLAGTAGNDSKWKDLQWQALAKRSARRSASGRRIRVGPGSRRGNCWSTCADGKVVSHRFTLVEGWNIRELRAALREPNR